MNIPKNVSKFIEKTFGLNVENMEFIITHLVKAKGIYNVRTKEINISKYICPNGVITREVEKVLVHELVHHIQVSKIGVEEYIKTYSTEKGKAFMESQAERYAFLYDTKYYLDTKMSKYRPINRG